MVKPFEVKLEAFDTTLKLAKPIGTSVGILVPRAWEGKKVRAILVEDNEEQD